MVGYFVKAAATNRENDSISLDTPNWTSDDPSLIEDNRRKVLRIYSKEENKKVDEDEDEEKEDDDDDDNDQVDEVETLDRVREKMEERRGLEKRGRGSAEVPEQGVSEAKWSHGRSKG
ncbi:hypothetical protein M0802_009195 [Mischocyttarus mexicanus]|nr:hypothetical protein M0802_009195 [Mischocyttarus mexicanus]